MLLTTSSRCLFLVVALWAAPVFADKPATGKPNQNAAGNTSKPVAAKANPKSKPTADQADTNIPPAAVKTEPKEDHAKDVPPPADPYDSAEHPMKTYRFIGVRFRDAIVPKFFFGIAASYGL